MFRTYTLIRQIARPQWRTVPLVSKSFSTFKFKETHEYLKLDDFAVGITDYAQSQLGEVVYVDLPEVGEEFEAGEAFGSVESVKAASDVYMPVSGKVTAVNERLKDSAGTVSEDPFGAGWFIKIKPTSEKDIHQLLDEGAYKKHCEEEKH